MADFSFFFRNCYRWSRLAWACSMTSIRAFFLLAFFLSGPVFADSSLTDTWSDSRTITEAFNTFLNSFKETAFFNGVVSLVSFSSSDAVCPDWRLSESYFLKIDIDISWVLCGPIMQFICAAISVVMLFNSVWVAWWIVFVI